MNLNSVAAADARHLYGSWVFNSWVIKLTENGH